MNQTFEHFGFETGEPCCVCSSEPTRVEPRFGYCVCEDHYTLSPTDINLFNNPKPLSPLQEFQHQMQKIAGVVPSSVSISGDQVTYTKHCPVAKKEYKVVVSLSQHIRLERKTENIQDILPDFHPDEREFLINGMTPAETGGLHQQQ